MQVKIPHVKLVKRQGKVYPYFNTGQKKSGKVVYARLPFLSADNFWDVYAALKAGRTKRENAKKIYTVACLMRDYMKSKKFRDRSAGTQKLYSFAIDKINENFGMAPVDELKPVDVINFTEANSASVGNVVMAVLSVAYALGRKLGVTDAEPTRDVDRSATGSHEPWEPDLLKAALESDNPRVRLATHLLYYTGQRISDVIAMRWNDITDSHVRVVQQKTGKLLDIPLHSALIAELARHKKQGFTILSNFRGQAIGDQTIRGDLQSFAKEHGYKIVPHGLRKNAVIAMLEAGCSIVETASITGQTHRMVEYYAKRLDQKKSAGAAILKWQNFSA